MIFGFPKSAFVSVWKDDDVSKTGGASPDKKKKSSSGRSKYERYLFVTSLLVMPVSVLGLLNGYFHFYNLSSYSANQEGISSTYVVAGYLGMFLSILISPIPDYILVPIYGYLSSMGIFSPFTTFLVCLIAAFVSIEFFSGKYAARPLLMKALSFVHVTENDLKVADKWLMEHGHFSIFIATFIPFFYSVAALASGTLKMKTMVFLLASIAGFGLRFIFLEYVGYYGIYIFTSSFDYSQRSFLFLMLILSISYATIYFMRSWQVGSKL